VPPNAPPPAANTASPTTTCTGDPGSFDAQGLPANLPTRVQLGGVAYLFAGAEEPDAAGTLTAIGCVGPFQLASTDQADQAEVVYLRSTQSGAGEMVYRFEAAPTYQIELQVTDQPQVIAADDQTYHLQDVWQPSTYSSLSIILFVSDPQDPNPAVIYGLDVSHSAAGDAIGEYRLPADNTAPAGDLAAAAAQVGLNPDLTIDGQRYLLVNIYTPVGTTRNGFMTLFGTTTGTSDTVLGRDQREPNLLVFQVDSGEANQPVDASTP